MRDAIDLPDSMPAIGRAAQVEAGEMGEPDYRLGRSVVMFDGGQLDGLRANAGLPEEGLPIRGRLGIAGEIATPNAA